jgi:hypothetical protein
MQIQPSQAHILRVLELLLNPLAKKRLCQETILASKQKLQAEPMKTLIFPDLAGFKGEFQIAQEEVVL